MSFILTSENGFVSDLATAKGWNDVVNTVDDLLPATSPLAAFCNSGTTTDIQGVIKDINNILLRMYGIPDQVSTLKGLRDNLSKVKEIAIVSQ